MSVVVPVYNAGTYLHECAESLLRQSLPAQRFEAIFVDDGSTDGSGAFLDELADRHEHVVLIHQENSGWPGKPRNRGIDAARGRYVFFLDSDDTLGDEALERMVAIADEDEADVVVPKIIGQGRRAPRELFRKDLHRTTAAQSPVMNSLKPQKLFRTSFLRDHALRFPEGRRRLEDQVFVVEAYLLARSISVLASYPCYYLRARDDGGNISHEAVEPVSYYQDLRDVLDVIERHTEPGPLRDQLLRRPYRAEMMRRLQGDVLLDRDPATRQSLLDEVRRLALERFGDNVVAGMPALFRVTSELVRAGDLAALEATAAYQQSLRARAVVSSLAWDGDAIELGFEAGLQDSAGWLHFPVRDGLALLPVPTGLEDTLATASRNVEQDLRRASVQLLLRHRGRQTEFLVPVTTTREMPKTGGGSFALLLASAARVRPRTAASGRPLDPGDWDLVARVSACGLTKETRLLTGADTRGLGHADVERAVRGDGSQRVQPAVDGNGHLRLRVVSTGRRGGPASTLLRVRARIRRIAPPPVRRAYRQLRAAVAARRR